MDSTALLSNPDAQILLGALNRHAAPGVEYRAMPWSFSNELRWSRDRTLLAFKELASQHKNELRPMLISRCPSPDCGAPEELTTDFMQNDAVTRWCKICNATSVFRRRDAVLEYEYRRRAPPPIDGEGREEHAGRDKEFLSRPQPAAGPGEYTVSQIEKNDSGFMAQYITNHYHGPVYINSAHTESTADRGGVLSEVDATTLLYQGGKMAGNNERAKSTLKAVDGGQIKNTANQGGDLSATATGAGSLIENHVHGGPLPSPVANLGAPAPSPDAMYSGKIALIVAVVTAVSGVIVAAVSGWLG